MHRALLLPEIVAAIVKSESGAPGYLYTCLFVNRLFFEEACRILWYGCGSSYNSATAGHVTPGIRQLAEISQRSRQRAQIYANFINVLYFAPPEETWPYGDEAQWHSDVACLQYPQLQELSFFSSDHSSAMNKGNVIINYAQSCLRTFNLAEGRALSDAFLDDLRTRSPYLQHLALPSCSDTMTQDGLLRFLRSFVSLKSLELGLGFRHLFTQDAFHAVGQYADVELLQLPVVQDDWIQGEQPMWPALKHLTPRISPRGLGLLSRHVPVLATLNATLPSSCTGIEAAFVNYPRLKNLTLSHDEGAILRRTDLLHIAECCPDLERLVIGDVYRRKAEGLDDSMVEKMAQGLSKLKELKLCYRVNTGDEALTLHSIKSLGRHCPNLKDLDLSCITIDWDEGDNSTISDSIWSLGLLLHRDHVPLWPEDYDPDSDNDNGIHVSRERIAEMAERFARRFPKMEYFSLEGGGEGEEELNDRLGDFIETRL